MKCIQCKEKIKKVERGDETMYGRIQSWHKYKLDYFDLSCGKSIEEFIQYKNPISIWGGCYGLYVSKVLLPEGFLCYTCIKTLEKEGKVEHIWTH